MKDTRLVWDRIFRRTESSQETEALQEEKTWYDQLPYDIKGDVMELERVILNHYIHLEQHPRDGDARTRLEEFKESRNELIKTWIG